jgi:S-adenosylmethionine hydrolase
LLAALVTALPQGIIIFAVVDPGVGSQDHKPVVLNLDGMWFVGPDNGIFDILVRRSSHIKSWEIPKPVREISNTFHGRDLYAPACAVIANNKQPEGMEFIWSDSHQWPDDLFECIYIDHFGNIMTGIRAAGFDRASSVKIKNHIIKYADYFSEVAPGQVFWYENSYGLLEIAVNQGSASEKLGLSIGSKVAI